MNKWSFWWIGGLCLAMGLLCWALLRAWRGQRTVPFAAFESLNTYQRARALQAQGDLTGAVRVWQEVLERNPQQEDALYALGQLFWKQGRYEEAVQTLQQLVKVNPASARGHLLLGRVYSTPWPGAPVDLSWAWEEVERCAELNPQDSEPFLYLGRIFFAKDEPQRALEYLSRVPLAAPRGPEAAYLAGIIHLRQGEADVAQQAFQRAWEQGERERPVPQPLPADDPAAARPLSPQDRVRLKALFGLAEIARQVGGYPEEVPAAYRWHWPPEESRSPVRFRPANDRLNPRPQEVGRAAWGDYDGDGDPDLAVASLHGLLRLYRNEGARFTDVAREIGLHDIFGSWDVVWADVEGDGTLDLYVVRSGWVGRSENALYLQRGGRFREVTRAVGLGGLRATSRVAFFDADGDGDLDLLEVGAAVQDAPPVRLYLREGSRFVDRAAERGLSSAGHVVDAAVGDYNGDGREDVFLLGWRQPGRLYRNEGGKFADVTALAGVGKVGEGYSVQWLDYDRDGHLDLLLTTHAPQPLALQTWLRPALPATAHTPHLFRNRGDGTFTEVTAEVGLNRCFGTVQAVVWDAEGDGFPDLLFANGSLEVGWLEPCVFLHNEEGQFVNLTRSAGLWSLGSALSVAVTALDEQGRLALYLSRSSLFLGDIAPGEFYLGARNSTG